VEQVSQSAGLRERRRPRIHTTRYGVPLGVDGKEPDVTADDLYRLGMQARIMWSERFMEFEAI